MQRYEQIFVLTALAGCARPEEVRPTTHMSPELPEETAETGLVQDTGSPPALDCTRPLPTAPSVSTLDIQTEEDFDFDVYGHIVAQDNSSLLGHGLDGSIVFIAPNIGIDAAGIRALPGDRFVVAQPNTGNVLLVDGQTGSIEVILSGLSAPNGLEVDLTGNVYIAEYGSEGGLSVLEMSSRELQILIEDYPINAVALSPDEQTIYVSSHAYLGGGFSGIVALDRGPDGQWGTSPRLIIETELLLQGLATDVCGNLYAVASSNGTVYRYNIADSTVDLLVDLDDGPLAFYSSARFSPGYGGFLRDRLYVTDRLRIFVLEVDIEGRHILAP